MCQTRRSTNARPMFAINTRFLLRATVVLIAVSAVLATAWPASAVAITWSGATDDLWSTSTNWSGGIPSDTPPVDVIFNNTDSNATAGTVTNVADVTQTINTLRYNNVTATTGSTQTTQINPGVTLNVTGNITGDGSTTGNYSFYVGSGHNNDAGTTGVTQVNFTGGGTLNISNGGANTGGDIVVRNTSSTGGGTRRAILDLSGLNQFTANVDQLMVGNSNNSTSNRPSGTMYLATNNTITLNNTGTAIGVGVNTAGNDGNPGNLYLGQTNVINTNGNILVSVKTGSTSNLAFNSAFAGSTLTVRGLTVVRLAWAILVLPTTAAAAPAEVPAALLELLI